MRSRIRRQNGFVLWEVLLSLLIVSVIAVSIFLAWRHHSAAIQTAPSAGSTSEGQAAQKSSPMQGILSEGLFSDHGGYSIPNSPWDAVFSGIVVHAHWADLQPTAGGQIADDNLIDQALAAVKTYNASHQHQLSIKIRVFAGIYAPDWAKRIGGFQPMPQLAGQYKGYTLGPFWRSDYLTAYQDLQSKLAAKYDSDPLIHDVTISGCMRVFAEPLDWGGFDNFGALFTQGFTNAAMNNCFIAEIDAHAVWKQTHSSLALNPIQPIVQGKTDYVKGSADLTETFAVMEHCRTALGSRCVLENNSLRQSFINQSFPLNQVYQKMQAMGPDLTIQTAAASGIGDMDTVIKYAASLGVNAVEIPAQYPTLISQEALAADNKLLLSNPTAEK